tara:strand:- start:30 stop:437 length:408 start_codon:yes stop_codon:yes gene_type:complete
MNEFFNSEQEKENIKTLFDTILNSNVNVYENVNVYKKHFISTIKNLERGAFGEKQFQKENQGDLSPIVDPLWFSIELMLSNLYGHQVANLMLWYLFDRIDINGNVLPYTDKDNNIIVLDTPEDLWDYVKLLIEDY